MSVSIDQVPMWLILDGNIGHAVGQTESGWRWTICGIWTPNIDSTRTRPARICRKCRSRLKHATLNPTWRRDGVALDPQTPPLRGDK